MYRLKDKKIIARTIKKGNRVVRNSYFDLYYLPINNQKCKVGVIVPKRVGKAVVRNRIKRLVREAFIIYLKTRNNIQGCCIFRIQKNSWENVDSGQIYSLIESALSNPVVLR